MKLLKRREAKDFVKEEKLDDVQVNVIKLNNRPKPEDPRQIMIISNLSEFGCETVGALYSIPKILRENPGYYKIIIGWYGREYFYRHLADEFWELKEEHQWLREFCRAFHHNSKNIKLIEDSLKEKGHKLVPVNDLGIPVVTSICNQCNKRFRRSERRDGMFKELGCPDCQSHDVTWSFFEDIPYWRTMIKKIPDPSAEKMLQAKEFLGKKTVGIFARGRKAYGRNLQPEFYVKLINLLKHNGYDVVWLGEKATCQKCPVDDVFDFCHSDLSRDLELTMAIVKQCEFTIQFWTASTRLSGMMGTPYLLFESPDQIWGGGQEGLRRSLCDLGPSKLSVNHFLNVYNDNDAGINCVRESIQEMLEGNYKDHIGLVENHQLIDHMKRDNSDRVTQGVKRVLNVVDILKKASVKSNLKRVRFVDANLPTSPENIIVFPFFGDLRSTLILSSLLLKRYKEEVKGSRYFILVSWPGFESLFPYVDEYWTLQNSELAPRLFSAADGLKNNSNIVSDIYKNLNYFLDVDAIEELEVYYKNGLTEEFFERFGKIRRFLPAVPSTAILGAEFIRKINKLSGLKTAIFPTTNMFGWSQKQYSFKPNKEFWIGLVENLEKQGISPVICQNFMTYDLSSELKGDYLYIIDEDIGKLLGAMRAIGCTLDIFNSISRLAILSRCPYLMVEERARYIGNNEAEIDFSCSKNISKSHIFSFPTIIDDGEEYAWKINLYDSIIPRLLKFIPDLNRDQWPSSSEIEEDVLYENFRKNKIKKLGTKFIKVERD